MELDLLYRYLGIAEKAILSAGDYLFAYREDVSVDSQYGKDIKLSADRESERIIIAALREESDLTILTEEEGLLNSGSGADQLKWIVDPLDGSLNYLRGIPSCCVSVGLWDSHTPVLGAVYDFNRNELFTGIAGTGAWLNGKTIQVSGIDSSQQAVLFTGFPSNTDYGSSALNDYVEQVRVFKKVRLMGSAALSLVYVASGRGEAYFERDIMFWDVAAGLAIVSGAGGKFTIQETDKDNACEVYATNGLIESTISECDRE